jgi:hypothetical protein
MGSLVGFKNPTLGDTSGVWTGATNTFASDDSDASVTADNTNSLRAKTFSFALPTNAIIRGLEISIEGEGDQAGVADRRLDVSITKDGTTATGTSKQFDLPQTTDGVVQGGGAADLWGITTGVDVVEVNAASFGVFIVKNTAVGTVNIDHIVMRIYFDNGVRGEWDVNFDTKRITHKRFYFDYDTGAAGTAPVIGDVLYNTTATLKTARVVTVEDWSVLLFGTLSMGEEHDGVAWADGDSLEVCSFAPFDTEVNGGLTEADIGSSFTVSAGTGTRTGVIRHVFSDGSTGTFWWDQTGEGGTALTGDETIAIGGQDRCDVTAAETSNDWTGDLDGAAYEPSRIQVAYDAETTVFESASGSKRLRDTLGFQHNMCVCDTTTGATAMVMERRQDQLVPTEGTLFLIDEDGTFTNNNALVACVEIDYDTELNGGFFDLIGLVDELEGATTLATATVRRVIDNGVSGTVYVTGITGGPFNGTEILRKNTGDQTRGTMNAPQRDRVGAAVINGSEVVSAAAHFSSQAMFSDLMDQFDELIALEDDNPAVGEVQDQGYRLLNAWQLPFFSARWLLKGAISQIDTVGGADKDSIHTDYFHLGALGDDANTNVYVDQDDTVLEQFWPAGTFEFLLRNKNKNAEIDNSEVTFYSRLYTELYDFATVSALGLRNPVGLNTADDSNNDTTAATVNATQVYHDIRWMAASHRINHTSGAGALPAVGEVLFNSTRSESAMICKTPALVASGTDMHVAANGVDISVDWIATDALQLLNWFDFDTQVAQFVVGEAIENEDDDWNGTVRFVQQYGATRGRVWFEAAIGVLADDDVIRLDGNGAFRATVNGTPGAAGTFTATNNAIPTTDTTVTRDVGDGGGDQPYYGVIDAETATVLQAYEMSKFISRAEAGGTSDPGSVLYPDNTLKQGRLYQKVNTLVSAADINKSAPIGSFAGGKWFLAPGWFIEDVAATDAQNYELVDANGVTRNPPNVQSISVSGLETASGGDGVLVQKRAESLADGTDTIDFNAGTPATIDFNGSGDFLDDGFETTVDANGTTSIVISGTASNNKTVAVASVTASLITLATGETLTNELASTTAVLRGDNVDKDMFSDGTGNNLGDGDYVVAETLPPWLPASGTIVVTDSVDGSETPGYEDALAYTSYSGSTFVLSGTLPRTYGATARVWVPFIRKNAALATESQTFIYSIDIPVVLNVRKKGIVPFTQPLVVGSGGLAATAVRQPDAIVE